VGISPLQLVAHSVPVLSLARRLVIRSVSQSGLRRNSLIMVHYNNNTNIDYDTNTNTNTLPLFFLFFLRLFSAHARALAAEAHLVVEPGPSAADPAGVTSPE